MVIISKNVKRKRIVAKNIRASSKVILSGIKPSVGYVKLSKIDKVALRKSIVSLGCLRYLYNIADEQILVDEIDELLEILFVTVNNDEAKKWFISNPSTTKHLGNTPEEKLINAAVMGSLLQSACTRLSRLVGENVYRHLNNTRETIEQVKLNCISAIYCPYTTDGIYTAEEITFINKHLKNLVSTIETLKNDGVDVKKTDVYLIILELIDYTATGKDYYKLILDRYYK